MAKDEMKQRHEERQGWLNQLELRRQSRFNKIEIEDIAKNKYRNSTLLNETKVFLLQNGFDVTSSTIEEFVVNPYNESLTVAGRIQITREFYGGRQGFKYELLPIGRYTGRVVVKNKEHLPEAISCMLQKEDRK